MRLAAVISIVALASCAGATSRGAASPSMPVVPCDDDIGHPHSGHEAGFRVVLGVVSVAPAYLPQVTTSPEPTWPYWHKAGLAVWSQASVTVDVPTSWRTSAAITWGNNTGAVSALRIAACPTYFGRQGWDAYAGGFYLRSRSACVPLVFRVGRQSATVRFGVGRRCAVR